MTETDVGRDGRRLSPRGFLAHDSPTCSPNLLIANSDAEHAT
ncbi:MAG: hypothetical protein R3C99_13220 [Pirellulaceae bacterium]